MISFRTVPICIMGVAKAGVCALLNVFPVKQLSLIHSREVPSGWDRSRKTDSRKLAVPPGHIPSITTSALSRHTSPRTCLEVFFFNPKSFFCDQGSCSNHSMEPSEFHQPSIRSPPVLGP